MHPIAWTSPQPLWTPLASADAPALLRFASDDFMEQLLGSMARDPAEIAQRIARWETWREPASDGPDTATRVPLPAVSQAGLRGAIARVRKGAALPVRTAPPDARALKLYQAAHQRYYIAAASLVCRQHGLPDRSVVPGGAEQVALVMRRLMPDPSSSAAAPPLVEFAYVKDAQGARWQRCGPDPSVLVADEDRVPTFALSFSDDTGLRRALWAALVPVGRREEYLGARVDPSVASSFAEGQRQSLVPAAPSATTSDDSVQARMVQFQLDVAEPWKTLIRSSVKLASDMAGTQKIGSNSEPPDQQQARAFGHNLAQAGASWLILLDFANQLSTQMPDLWQVVLANGSGRAALSAQRQSLYDWLGTATMSSGLRLGLCLPGTTVDVRPPYATLRDALVGIAKTGVGDALEAQTVTYNAATVNAPGWPASHFALAGLTNTFVADGPFTALTSLPGSSTSVPADPVVGPAFFVQQAQWVDRLTAQFARALDPTPPVGGPPLPFAAQVAKAAAANPGDFLDGGWFVVRHVWLNADCGPLHPPVLSAPSARFKIASFFDADAPARPIRISLPIDTSPAGLRKFNRNTAFVLSDMLCGQVQRAKGLGFIDLVLSVLPWPLHKDLDVGEGGPCQSGGLNIGMICSLSIPIITICALILLMIIISLLDLIFHWLPYFIMCFPVPGLKGKKGASS